MNLTDALNSATKGAAAGAVAGPIGAIVGGFGGLVVDIAPEVGRWLFGDTAEQTSAMVVKAVESVTGTTDVEAAQAVLAKNPEAASKLRVALAMIAAQQQAEADRAAEAKRAAELAAVKTALDDRINARGEMLALADKRNGIAWVPAILSAVILIAFSLLTYFAVIAKQGINDQFLALANVLFGTFAAMATQVANYWLGSSSGSTSKNAQIAALNLDARASVPAPVVQSIMSAAR